MRYYFASLLIIAIFIVPWFATNYPAAGSVIVATIEKAGAEVAAVILVHKPVTVDQLKSDYASAATPGNQKIRILVVPGHEPGYGGAEYRDIKERDMTVELAKDLTNFLTKNERYEVFTTRYEDSWTPQFADYFKSDWTQIGEWMRAHRAEVKDMARVGSYSHVTPTVYHNNVKDDVGLRLYGINKWADENNIDIVVHIHFNDYPGHADGQPGKYTGFSIYVPEKQYYNSTSTKALAQTVYKRLSKYNAVSNLPGESGGIIEEQDLIAIGSFNSVDAASMLIEYGYIYEPQFQDPDVRHTTINELAYETYIGLLDFFEPERAAVVAKTYDTLVLPHQWSSDITGKNDSPGDVFALQTALILDGDYPPTGSSANDCPRSGRLGPCTKAALDQFQGKYDISGEKGIAGPKTIDALNRIF